MTGVFETGGGLRVTVAGERGEEATLSVSGHLTSGTLRQFTDAALAALDELAPARVVVDLSGVEHLDSAGALGLLELEHETAERSLSITFRNVSEKARRIIGLIDRKALAAAPGAPASTANPLARVGDASLRFFRDFVSVMTFVGELLAALVHSLFHPRSVRWSDVLFYMKRAGVDGLPIITLVSLLLGLIIAFMSSLQLRLFGANIYVASLVAVAIVKELGPIMTAILVAGRTGSAYAAEIGTMVVNEEVDALVSMGFHPVRFLAVPKVLATIAVVPVLTIYADLFGILGGLIIGVVGLDLTAFTYIQQTERSLRIFDIVSSLVKSGFFAMFISSIACQRGFAVRGGAEGVGASTTSAVVAAVVLIIVVDSAFAVILYYI
jgi:phospholipid/cholesterol/gamma-HCH transport system permease protein